MNVRRWLRAHSLKLLAIRDTPQAVAGGAAIGLFFGFTPLFGLKTISAMFFAWLTGCNILAAVLGTTVHDVFFVLMPALYLFEYDLGFWWLAHPHHWPHGITKMTLTPDSWRSWTTYITIGKPMLVGSVICGAPASAAAFFLIHTVVARHQRKRQLRRAAARQTASAGSKPGDPPPQPPRVR